MIDQVKNICAPVSVENDVVDVGSENRGWSCRVASLMELNRRLLCQAST